MATCEVSKVARHAWICAWINWLILSPTCFGQGRSADLAYFCTDTLQAPYRLEFRIRTLYPGLHYINHTIVFTPLNLLSNPAKQSITPEHSGLDDLALAIVTVDKQQGLCKPLL